MAIYHGRQESPNLLAEQTPNLSHPCGTFAVDVVCGNLHAIELQTNQTPDYIFAHYMQPFLGALQGNNTVQAFTTPGGSQSINVTAPGQELKISLKGLAGWGQPAFYVRSKRVDTTNHVLSVVTLTDHPLAGWRFWRVYSSGTNRVVIETGAYDSAGPGMWYHLLYYNTLGIIKRAWREYLQFIEVDLGATRGNNLTTVGATSLDYLSPWNTPSYGYSDIHGLLTAYILDKVCQSTTSC